jgi:Leucine-rich repeat (LRR) protein
LKRLYLSNNQLSGTIPALPESLEALDLSLNRKFSDTVSSLLGYPLLQNIDLHGNSMFGTIPQQIFWPPFHMVNLGVFGLQTHYWWR